MAYLLSYLVIDKLVSPALPATNLLATSWLASAVVIGIFAVLFVLHLTLARNRRSAWMSAFYVHASNGFYLDVITRRVIPIAVPSVSQRP